MSPLAIVAPSFIDSEQRLNFARTSVASLDDTIADAYPRYIVADVPGLGTDREPPSTDRFFEHRNLYNAARHKVRERNGVGSASALLDAVEMADEDGFDLCFIHLDDLAYRPEFKQLLAHAEDAFRQDPSLQIVKLGGHPLVHDECDPMIGNRTFIRRRLGRLSFGGKVILRPERKAHYTLWWSPFTKRMVKGTFWPIGMWMSVYRTDILKTILRTSGQAHLADVERYYKKADRWNSLIREHPGTIGFINMQAAGVDQHHCAKWREVMEYPNIPFF